MCSTYLFASKEMAGDFARCSASKLTVSKIEVVGGQL